MGTHPYKNYMMGVTLPKKRIRKSPKKFKLPQRMEKTFQLFLKTKVP
jgi:hypothetical protein